MIKNLVYGVGFDSVGIHRKTIKRKHTRAYKSWGRMLERCYSEKWHNKHPSYLGCLVDERWHDFQVFAEWFEQNYIEGFELDKDILKKGNKVYSPETCLFIPKYINTLIKTDLVKANKLPRGIRENNGKFEARCNIKGISKSIGRFNTSEEASTAYITIKEKEIKRVANEWQGRITKACYNALINYKL